MNVAAIIVTRGDVDLEPIIDSLCDEVAEIIVWDNLASTKPVEGRPPMGGRSLRIGGPDLSVYGRYAAIEQATGDLILVQDDDVVLPPESIQALIDKWMELAEDGVTDVLVANMPDAFRHSFYEEHCLVGFGAVFRRDLPFAVFDHYHDKTWDYRGIESWFFLRTCDIVFTALTPRILVDLPYENLPWAEDETRMYRSAGHQEERARMLELVRSVRDA